ncbi:hypothetical protein [Microbacterium sp. NPDC076911]|uniref:hypothetical protein n=1 Tax=Microbacterium sp. NPDC076911 TaxID=3154958 RepID=UPI003433D6C3
MDRNAVLAWVESPLQLIGAAEWGAAHRRAVPVAGRLTAQMPETADELLARRAWFGRMDPYLGIPWKLLSQHGHWLIGDGFSGQFRLAAAVLRPRQITFLDDGSNTIPLVESLVGSRPYARPGIEERGLTTRLRPFALENVRRAARARNATVYSAFDLGVEREDALANLGFSVHHHSFEWTRSSAQGVAVKPRARRIVLGSARPVDGRMPIEHYTRWVAHIAAAGAVEYFPHRRETPSQLEAVRAIAGVAVVQTSLPIELILAGHPTPVDVFSQPSTTTTTLPLVLRGTGSRVHKSAPSPEIGIST